MKFNDLKKVISTKAQRIVKKQINNVAPIVTTEIKKIASVKVESTSEVIFAAIKIIGLAAMLFEVSKPRIAATDVLDNATSIIINSSDTYNFYIKGE